MLVISCDVGSGSVRVAIIEFNGDRLNGKPLAIATKPITIYNPQPEYFEQSSGEIWDNICECVQTCLRKCQCNTADIKAIGFSATCSLVVVEKSSNKNEVIMWMDHRALNEAQEITDSNSDVLKQFGGICSPEFSISKLVWLKRNDVERFNAADAFLELPDWLAWKCIRSDFDDNSKAIPRSLCSVVCKWGYDGEKKKWDDSFLKQIGLEEFVSDKTKIGAKTEEPGKLIGYLCKHAAIELGLGSPESGENLQIAIASPIIDAHSGVLAMLQFNANNEAKESANSADFDKYFCLIAGTSTCHLISNREKTFTKGVWGPYFDIIFPGYYVREAGQSATGKLIDHIIRSHPDRKEKYHDKKLNEVVRDLNLKLKGRKKKNKLIVNPCFHGNRSPLALPNIKGAIYGFTLDETELVDVYEATIEALAYETKFILEELKAPSVQEVLISGGLAKNEVYMQIHADVLGIEVSTFAIGEADLMLVGAAVLARQSALGSNLNDAKDLVYPHLQITKYKPSANTAKYHDVKYRCYREFLSSCQKVETTLKELD